MVKYYFDTCTMIYFIEKNDKYFEKVLPYFKQLEKEAIKLVASPLLLQEVLTGIYKSQTSLAKKTFEFLVQLPNTSWIDYNVEIADLAAQISSTEKVKAPDAIHLATAYYAKCRYFITHDLKITRIKNTYMSHTLNFLF